MTTAGDRPFRLGSAALPVYLPTLLFSLGEGAIIPIIPHVADSLGASLALAGFVAAMLMVGELVGDIPSGALVSRIGERTAMIGASGLAMAGLAVCMLAPNPLLLILGVFLIGLATAIFSLARQAFMTTFVPVAYRARALSLLGGTFRVGTFVGPFLSASVISLTGTVQATFWVHIVGCVGAAVMLLLLPDPTATFGATGRMRAAHAAPSEDAIAAPAGAPATGSTPQVDAATSSAPAEADGLFRTIVRHRGVLARMGTVAAIIGGLRASRQVLLPLWAVAIGMSDANAALVIGVAGAVDFALFFASGQIMDRFGRLYSALPSAIGLGVGHLLLAATAPLEAQVAWFVTSALLLSLANGIGSGILMTFGADLAPRADPAPFLGAYRFTGDAGNAAAPLAIAGLTAAISLPVAAGVLGVVGLVGAVLLGRWVPRYIPRPGR